MAAIDDQLLRVQMHLERSKRHYELAVRTYDDIALCDLSHALRLWTELAKPLEDIAPNFSTAISFKTGRPSSRIIKAARGYEHIIAILPDGVTTYAASQNNIFYDPNPSGEKWSFIIELQRESQGLLLKNFCLIRGRGEQLSGIEKSTMTRCNFRAWMSSEVIRIAYLNSEKVLTPIGISREIFVKRVANILDGSHASAGQEDATNRFDEPIKNLLQYRVASLPLPYFILLKIAQDILKIAPKHLK